MERFLIRPVAAASVRRIDEDQPTQSPSPSQVPKNKCTHLATIEKWKLDWLGLEKHADDKKNRMFCKACRNCGQQAAKVVNAAQVNSSADFIKGTENVKKYVAFRHQATKQHAIAYGE